MFTNSLWYETEWNRLLLSKGDIFRVTHWGSRDRVDPFGEQLENGKNPKPHNNLQMLVMVVQLLLYESI